MKPTPAQRMRAILKDSPAIPYYPYGQRQKGSAFIVPVPDMNIVFQGTKEFDSAKYHIVVVKCDEKISNSDVIAWAGSATRLNGLFLFSDENQVGFIQDLDNGFSIDNPIKRHGQWLWLLMAKI